MYFFILYVVMCATDMHSLIKGNLLACLLSHLLQYPDCVYSNKKTTAPRASSRQLVEINYYTVKCSYIPDNKIENRTVSAVHRKQIKTITVSANNWYVKIVLEALKCIYIKIYIQDVSHWKTNIHGGISMVDSPWDVSVNKMLSWHRKPRDVVYHLNSFYS